MRKTGFKSLTHKTDGTIKTHYKSLAKVISLFSIGGTSTDRYDKQLVVSIVLFDKKQQHVSIVIIHINNVLAMVLAMEVEKSIS